MTVWVGWVLVGCHGVGVGVGVGVGMYLYLCICVCLYGMGHGTWDMVRFSFVFRICPAQKKSFVCQTWLNNY